MPAVDATLDLSQTGSPMLPLLVRQALARLGPGQRLEVHLASAQWARDLPLILRRTGDRCLVCEPTAQGWRLVVARGGPSAAK
ncbi:MAG: sulfurtransferase TusA family protein [Thermodesulfobacteriota bacterium]